ncbi:MAG: hypothetical protein VX252_09785 [Myxococcota bacterium]|nr:hypothetical protein [Myxococcota bacterium]
MSRTYLGILILLGFVAIVVYLAMGQFDTRCRVCIEFKGQRVCEIAVAADPLAAQQQAMSSACSQVAGGVTDSFNCTGRAPLSIECSE